MPSAEAWGSHSAAGVDRCETWHLYIYLKLKLLTESKSEYLYSSNVAWLKVRSQNSSDLQPGWHGEPLFPQEAAVTPARWEQPRITSVRSVCASRTSALAAGLCSVRGSTWETETFPTTLPALSHTSSTDSFKLLHLPKHLKK